MSKVEVLCPNGRRVNVKVSPNTKILQILEEACTKQGFLPASDFELKHGRRSLDVTLSVQFAALPNLAKLELVKLSKSRAESAVVIALQTADGQRMQAEFLPSLTLWQILQHFEQSGEGKPSLTSSLTVGEHPVCIYMKEEIISEFALKETTLRSLGLTGGRAAIRHLFRPVSDGAIAEIIANIDRERLRQSRLAAAAAAAEPRTDVTSSSSPGVSTEVQPSSSDVQHKGSVYAGNVVESHQPMEIDAGISSYTDFAFPSAASFDDAPQMLPFQHHTVPPPFAEFKFPEETKGQNLYRNELSEVNPEDLKPCDRETVVYSLDEEDDEVMQAMAEEEIPDEFFEVTEADVRKMWQDMLKRNQEMIEQPLLTQASRRKQIEAKMSRYKRVILRIQFPDHLVVQALFRTTDTVFTLYKFVKENLQDRTLQFELYTAPPKTVLKDNTETLVEADLAPMSLVYFGSSVKQEHYLSDEVISSVQSQKAANLVVLNLAETTRPASASGSASAVTSYSSSAGSSGAAATSGGPSGAVPKWFKIGKK